MKKFFVIIMVLISIAFLNACKDKEADVGDKAKENNAVEPGTVDDEASETTETDTNDGSETEKKPKLPKIPSSDGAEEDGDVESEVKSILSEMKEEDETSPPAEETDTEDQAEETTNDSDEKSVSESGI